MKFRAVVTDSTAMKDLTNIVNSLSKLARECVLRIAAQKINFIILDEEARPRRPLVWCELPINFYFREFNLVGLSNEYNEIYLSFTIALLARSLSTLKQNAKLLKIKLTNKESPCLTLEIELNAVEGSQNLQLIHDVPVEVISQKNWHDYQEPQFNDFHVSIELPYLKLIKNIVERMKNMSQFLILSADRHGRLTLQIKTTLVKLSAHFPNLNLQSFAVGEIEAITRDEENMDNTETNSHTISCTIEIKKCLMFLSGIQLNCKATCSIVKDRMVKLALEQPGVLSLQCFFTEVSL